MWSFSKTLLTCWLISSLAVGCATTGTTRPAPATPASAPTTSEDAPVELPPAPGWPPYYSPRLLRDVTGTDEVTSETATIPRGYVFHRTDVEKVRILRARSERCATDLGTCERRVSELTATPGFWNRWEGRVLLIGLGFLAGTATTVAVAVGVNQ